MMVDEATSRMSFTFTFSFGVDYVLHQLRPNVQPRHNQRLGKYISSSYELERMHNLHWIKS